MNKRNQQFTIAIVVIGLLVCSSIMAYFTVFAPKVVMPDLTNLQETPPQAGDQQNEPAPITPAPEAPKPSTQPTAPVSAPGTASATPPPVEFGTDKVAADDPKAEIDTKLGALNSVLQSGRLAPDMFAYSTLPYDAPLADFPLVLVGQKSLEWYKAPTVNMGSTPGGIGTAPTSIYGRPPGPPSPPPTPPPRPPPGPPPKPPPEVSPSGL